MDYRHLRLLSKDTKFASEIRAADACTWSWMVVVAEVLAPSVWLSGTRVL